MTLNSEHEAARKELKGEDVHHVAHAGGPGGEEAARKELKVYRNAIAVVPIAAREAARKELKGLARAAKIHCGVYPPEAARKELKVSKFH
ncbi:MAG: hypothetical protein QW407_05670 [Thermofilaceae archaeon]